MIARRTLAWLLVPALARAQPRMPVVGFVGFASPEGDAATVVAFRDGMRALGQVEERSWRLESRHAGGDIARGAGIISELAALPVDVFVVPGPAAARAVRRASAIPLVAVGLPPVPSDPELFASLARPGGTVTGFASFGEEMSAKRIEFLRETIPGLSAVGILHNSTDPTFDAWGRLTEESAAGQGLRALRLGIASQDGAMLTAGMRGLREGGAQAVVVVRDFLTSSLIHEIVAAAGAEGIAVIGDQASYAQAGALFSYGANQADLFRRAAGYVVRILRGEKPSDLPVQLPTAIEFVVNLRTARALGLALPQAIMARADEVIE